MDLRIQRTYKALIDAFTSLMETRRYHELTVAELCDQAMIRRTTFYKHFASKDEFFTFYIATLHDEFYSQVGDESHGETFDQYSSQMLLETTRFLLEHKGLVDNVLESPSAPLLLSQLEQLISRQVVCKMLQFNQNATPEFVESAGTFYGAGMLAILKRWWLEGRNTESLNAMLEVLSKVSHAL